MPVDEKQHKTNKTLLFPVNVTCVNSPMCLATGECPSLSTGGALLLMFLMLSNEVREGDFV